MKLELTYQQVKVLNDLIKHTSHVFARETLRESLIIRFKGHEGAFIEVDDAILNDALLPHQDDGDEPT